MNYCANHPEIPAVAYCQNCGKPLCGPCVRSISSVIFCESCLAAKLGVSGSATGTAAGTAYTVSGNAGGVNYTVSGVDMPSGGPNPGLATLLGFIPGVGAMYNGQFIKALVHVLVFVVLIGISQDHPIFGIFIAAWVFYQVFDANQTAKARRDGMPLPDPFGLNELGNRMGIPNRPFVPPAGVPPAGVPPAGVPPVGAGQPPAGATWSQTAYDVPPPPSSAYSAAYTPVPPVPPMPPDPLTRRPEPVGAIVLIVVGMLFLFSTMGIFRVDWIGRGWPILIILLGAWLLVRRVRDTPRTPPEGGAQ